MEDMKKLYDNNPDFKLYVDRYMKSRCIPQDKLEDVLQHSLVQSYAEYLQENSKGTTQ